jgi:hypothetical protein
LVSGRCHKDLFNFNTNMEANSNGNLDQRAIISAVKGLFGISSRQLSNGGLTMLTVSAIRIAIAITILLIL